MNGWQPGDPVYPRWRSVFAVRRMVQLIDDHPEFDYNDWAEQASAASWPIPQPANDLDTPP